MTGGIDCFRLNKGEVYLKELLPQAELDALAEAGKGMRWNINRNCRKTKKYRITWLD